MFSRGDLTLNKDELKALNRLAREQAKLNLLKDICFDITVCNIEGWDYIEYLLELKKEIEHFISVSQTDKQD